MTKLAKIKLKMDYYDVMISFSGRYFKNGSQ